MGVRVAVGVLVGEVVEVGIGGLTVIGIEVGVGDGVWIWQAPRASAPISEIVVKRESI